LFVLAGVFLINSPAKASTVLIDFGNFSNATGTQGSGTIFWNNYNGGNPANNSTNTVINSGYSVSLVDTSNAAFGALTANDSNFFDGNNTGAAGPIGNFPGTATSDYILLNQNGASGLFTGSLTLSGLDPTGATSYTFTFLSSRGPAGGTPRDTDVTFTGANSGDSGVIVSNPGSVANTTPTTVSGIIPNGSGNIIISVNNAPNNTFGGYLNAMQIDTVSTLPEPSTIALSVLGGLGLFFVVLRRRQQAQVL